MLNFLLTSLNINPQIYISKLIKTSSLKIHPNLPPQKQKSMGHQKGKLGMISGVLTTALLQPFENIKMALMLPPKNLSLKQNFLKNCYHAAQYINKADGINGFYKGMVAATLKAATGCYMYFGILRYFEKEDQSAGKNFIVSSFARIVSTIITNPLNVIETRFQLADFHQYHSVRGAVKEIYQKEGFQALFSGCLASCIKEGLFSGFYYMMYEELKQMGLNRIASGFLSGMISTAMTHPFQLIRARLQTIGLKQKHTVSQHLILRQLRELRSSGEWFKGLTPRLIKKPLSNTLAFYIFEIMEEINHNKKAKQ